MNQTSDITLDDLQHGMIGLTPAVGSAYSEAASVCLDNQSHSSPTTMDIFLHKKQARVTGKIHWKAPDDQANRCWQDLKGATEYGACGIAALVLYKLEGFYIVSSSAQGTGFDYWLRRGPVLSSGTPLMKGSVRLEVSGILHGSSGTVSTRVKQKLKQTERSAGKTPAVVVVVEFGQPELRITES